MGENFTCFEVTLQANRHAEVPASFTTTGATQKRHWLTRTHWEDRPIYNRFDFVFVHGLQATELLNLTENVARRQQEAHKGQWHLHESTVAIVKERCDIAYSAMYTNVMASDAQFSSPQVTTRTRNATLLKLHFNLASWEQLFHPQLQHVALRRMTLH